MNLCASFCASGARGELVKACKGVEELKAKHPTLAKWICNDTGSLCSDLSSLCQDVQSAEKCTSTCKAAAQKACKSIAERGLKEVGCSADSEDCVAKLCALI